MSAMTIVGRAVVAGVGGGLCAAIFLATVGEQTLQTAIELEENLSPAGPATTNPTEVGRSVQVGGGLAAVALFGLLNGVMFGTVLARLRHRLGLADDFTRSVVLATVAFVTTALFPAVKYPANPPGVGDPSTISQRTLAYLSLIAAALALSFACVRFHQLLRTRVDQPSAITATVAATVVGFVLLGIVWPANPDRVPDGFPAGLLWRFRLESLAVLSIQWAALGLGTGWLLSRRHTAQHEALR